VPPFVLTINSKDRDQEILKLKRSAVGLASVPLGKSAIDQTVKKHQINQIIYITKLCGVKYILVGLLKESLPPYLVAWQNWVGLHIVKYYKHFNKAKT
jgi:hypothetical protein